jgi:cell division inhibitor SepF
VAEPEIKTLKPKNFEEAQAVVDCLRDKLPIIINFEETPEKDVQRIMDFISGSIYALDGNIKPVSSKVFIFAPDNVSLEASENKKNW